MRIPLDPKRRFPVLAAIAAAAIVCLGRAVVMAAKDGWLASGQTAIGVASAARNTTAYLAPVLGLSVLFAAIAWWGGRRPRLAGAIALLAAVPVAWMHVAVRLPLSEYHAPGFSGSRGLLAQGVAVAIAIFAVGVVVGSPPARLRSAVSGLAVAALLAAGIVRTFGSTAKDARPSVIVISLDTVRSDRLGCYGYPSGTTPAIDRLAETCVVFENASSPEAWTLTAHMTLMTSLRPLAHGVDENRPLPGSVPTLAETFRDAGYATAAVVDDVGWLHPFFGFDRGFDTYRRIPGDARAKNEALGAVLDDLQGGGASFLLLHYFDAHGDWGRQPYEAPEEDLRRFAGWYGGSFDGCDDRGRCGAELLRAWSDEGTPPSEDVRRYLSSLYDAGIAALDRDLGVLFTELDRRGLLERSVVVLTADHGEEFFEHGLALHRQLYRECTAVPLLVRPPGGTAPRRVSTAVGLVDVAPTILDLAGIQRPDSMQGTSLAEAVSGNGSGFERQPVILEAGEDRSGIRTEHYLLLRTGAEERLYDLARDPREQEDLLATGWGPRELADLRARLDEALAMDRALLTAFEGAPGRPDSPGLSPRERRRLRGLGYAGKGR